MLISLGFLISHQRFKQLKPPVGYIFLKDENNKYVKDRNNKYVLTKEQ